MSEPVRPIQPILAWECWGTRITAGRGSVIFESPDEELLRLRGSDELDTLSGILKWALEQKGRNGGLRLRSEATGFEVVVTPQSSTHPYYITVPGRPGRHKIDHVSAMDLQEWLAFITGSPRHTLGRDGLDGITVTPAEGGLSIELTANDGARVTLVTDRGAEIAAMLLEAAGDACGARRFHECHYSLLDMLGVRLVTPSWLELAISGADHPFDGLYVTRAALVRFAQAIHDAAGQAGRIGA